MRLKLYCEKAFYRDRSQEKSLKFRISQPIHSQVRFAVQSLDETLALEPQMFSHSKTSQESQVVMKHVLIDSVLSLHHFAFKLQIKEEKHVSMAEKNLGAALEDEHLETRIGNRG